MYHRVEAALEAASLLWDDEDHLYSQIRLKRTVTVCVLVRPADDDRL